METATVRLERDALGRVRRDFHPDQALRERACGLTGAPHYNKASGEFVPTPHVHERNTAGGARSATFEEIPR